MREISAEQLKEILSEHELWLDWIKDGRIGIDSGKKADLQGVDLRGADLRGTNFSHKLFRLFLIKTQIIHTHITFKLISFCKRVVSHANHAF
jgi:uncharacterized protein YjbI with pentapeptide repeats